MPSEMRRLKQLEEENGMLKRIRPEGDYAACRRVISARVARPVSVSEYGASNS